MRFHRMVRPTDLAVSVAPITAMPRGRKNGSSDALLPQHIVKQIGGEFPQKALDN